jgi:cellulose synthase/poly-beta-1,6-N-acetylglucosamine synthase-like glycosyltransferase
MIFTVGWVKILYFCHNHRQTAILFYSFIIPAFNRPDEIHELLESFTQLSIPTESFDGFEVIIADGSPTALLAEVIKLFSARLTIQHLHRPRLAISPSRNLGAEHARGNYLVFLDSDVILPPQYLVTIHAALQAEPIDAFGGPDAAHASFTNVQKAISFAMTSYLTTGGIRGGKKQIHQYNPRGFNMGIRKEVFQKVNGYSTFTCGEDIELSIRIVKAGFTVKLIPQAYVYHKRRTTFKSFFRQVFRFGAARINIFYRHRTELKITHLFPSLFLLFVLLGWIGVFIDQALFTAYTVMLLVYYGLIFILATLKEKSFVVGVLSIISSTCQLIGYGSGLLTNAFAVFVHGKKDGLELGASK